MATAIPTTFGEGGSGLTPGGNGSPTLAGALREAAADLAALKGATVAAISGSAVTAIVTADASDAATTQALANECKAKINALITRVEAIATTVTSLRSVQATRAALTTGLTAP